MQPNSKFRIFFFMENSNSISHSHCERQMEAFGEVGGEGRGGGGI
jgi:hypothetical protein